MQRKQVSSEAVLEVDAEGPAIGDDRSASDLIASAISERVRTIVVPAVRLEPAFFRLRTGLAGAFLQKFVNYRIRLVVLGDVSAHADASPPFADFVRESNRGNDVWFARDEAALQALIERT